MKRPPATVTWFKVYCGFLTAMYALTVMTGIMLALAPPVDPQMSQNMNGLVGLIVILIGLVLGVATSLPFFVRPAPWVWVYGIVLIALGCTSLCLIPACIPLLIFWLKPNVQWFYDRKV